MTVPDALSIIFFSPHPPSARQPVVQLIFFSLTNGAPDDRKHKSPLPKKQNHGKKTIKIAFFLPGHEENTATADPRQSLAVQHPGILTLTSWSTIPCTRQLRFKFEIPIPDSNQSKCEDFA